MGLFGWFGSRDGEKGSSAKPVTIPEGCPMHEKSKVSGGGCPVNHGETGSKINPLNMMPNLPQTPHEGQRASLSTERTLSIIPKSSDKAGSDDAYASEHTGGMVNAGSSNGESSVWEYPSHQQFYNALRRKGHETNEADVPVMVDIHNFLNDACWEEIKRWESTCHPQSAAGVSLVKFRGRPEELSPKARIMTLLGSAKPFDRHDWTIDRDGSSVRYVIDYYSGHDERLPTGELAPSFHVDVRPALDSPTAAYDRLKMLAKEVYAKYSQ